MTANRTLQRKLGSAFQAVPGVRERNRLRAFVYRRVRPYIPVEMLAEKGETFVQVGTPNLYTAESLLHATGPTGRVVIVEAGSANFRHLADWVGGLHRDDRGRIALVNRAALNETREIELVVSSTFAGDSFLGLEGIEVDNKGRPGAVFDRSEVVMAEPLDQILGELGVVPHSVMLTINGAELLALRGARGTLRSMGTDSRVFVKTHALMDGGETIREPVCSLLGDAGYAVTRTMRSKSYSASPEWPYRQGDVFAYRVHA